MTKFTSALLLGTSLLASVPASAATLVQNFSGNYDNGIILPAFDRMLGTLQSVGISANYTENSMATGGSLDPNSPAASYAFTRVVDIYAYPPSNRAFVLVPSLVLRGTKSFEAGSSLGSCSASASGTFTYDQANAYRFYGTGNGSVFAVTQSGSTACNEGMKPQVRISGTVTYTFDETTPGPVPEPTTWAMMLVGFGVIAATARYRRRSTHVTYA